MTAARLYRVLLGLFPPCVSAEDRTEMAATFGAMLAGAGSARRRLRVVAVVFRRLPGLIMLEWRDHLRRGVADANRSDAIRSPADRRGGGPGGVWSALRHGARNLRKAPAFTWSVIGLLGLGVGAVTAVFSVVDHVVLRPLPYPAADRLVKMENGSHSGPTFRRFEGMRTVEAWAGGYARDANLTGGEEPVRLREAQITRGYFTLFGARPALGRLFVASDFESGEGVVLGHGTWSRVFGGDSTVVGRTIRIDGVSRVVLGVVDAAFVPPEALEGGRGDFWRPLDWQREALQRDDHWMLGVVGRLLPGVSLAQAQAEADALAAQRADANPDQFIGNDGAPRSIPVTPLHAATVGGVRAGLGFIFGAVTLLLLVACVNVAHLFLARAVERSGEMSVRRALGAGTAALARQLAAESLLVGAAGTALGAAVATISVGAFRTFAPGFLPRMEGVGVDVRVLGFAVAVGLATSLAFGLLPALRLALRDRGNPLHLAARGSTPSRRAHGARHALVVVEVALSLVLAAQAGWLMRTFANLQGVELGFRTADVWTLPLRPTDMETPADWNRRVQAIRESLLAVPGVRSASFGLTLPLEWVGGDQCCWRTSPDFIRDAAERPVAMHPVDADYFDLFALRLVAGRPWSRAEAGSATSPAVLSEPLAVDVFGAAELALGQSMKVSDVTYTIVGVVADNRHYGPDQDHGLAAYIPASTIPFAPDRAHMAVLTEGPQAGMPRALARAVWRVEADLPVPLVRSMDEWASAATSRTRFLSGLFTAFGGVALVLVAGGLAGTLLYTVRVRRRELGIRMALGATSGRVERSVLGRGLALALAGILLGGVGAWVSGRLLEGLVDGIETRDAATFLFSVAVLASVALASSWLPARRAARTDPMETLRLE